MIGSEKVLDRIGQRLVPAANIPIEISADAVRVCGFSCAVVFHC